MSLSGLTFKSKNTITVGINVGYNVVIPVTINHDTGLLFTLAEHMNDSDGNDSGNDNCSESLDMSVVLPGFDEFATIVYITFISGTKDMNDVLIVDRHAMAQCLAIYDLTGDTNFFNWLLVSLFKLWTTLSPVMYGNNVSNEVKWEIWLRLPYQLLPDVWQSDTNFMNSWLQRSDNKHVVINGDETFTYEVVTTNTKVYMTTVTEQGIVDINNIITTKATTYDRQHDNVVISNNKIEDAIDDNIVFVEYNTTYNDHDQGKITVIENNTIDNNNGDNDDGNTNINSICERTVYYAINGDECGLYKTYEGDNLCSQWYRINGRMEGMKIQYFTNGKVKHETSYKCGQNHGLEIKYYDTNVYGPLPQRKMVAEWDRGKKMSSTYYYQNFSYIETRYITDDGNIQPQPQPQPQPLCYKFYTGNGNLTRKITNPVDTDCVKHDTHYDDDGLIIKSDTYSNEWKYSIRRRLWRN